LHVQRTPRHGENQIDKEGGQSVNVEFYESAITKQAQEIVHLRAQLKTKATQGATIQAATLSERPYVFRSDDVKAGRAHPRPGVNPARTRKLSTDELQSLTEQRRRVRCGPRVEEHMSQVAAAHSFVGTLDGENILQHKALPHIGRKRSQMK
jgi:hypothetical protein